jgi:hypothetical protein
MIKEYEVKYASFVSASSKCKTPNFNRDNFKDRIYRYIEENDFQYNVKRMKDAMDYLNTALGNDMRPGMDKSKLRDNVKTKCEKGGLWLFAWQRDINDNDIDWAVQATSVSNLIEI